MIGANERCWFAVMSASLRATRRCDALLQCIEIGRDTVHAAAFMMDCCPSPAVFQL